jgi:acyl carrier protein
MSLTKRRGTSALDLSPTASTAARVKSTLARILDIDRPEHILRDSASLYSAGIQLDSLTLLRLLVSLEAEFGIEIDDEDVMEADLDTVASLVRLVETAVARQGRTGVEADPRGA